MLCFEDSNFASRDVGQAYIDKHTLRIGGYYIIYEDGYESFSPTEAFEEGYKLV